MVMAVHSSSIIAERALKQREELMSALHALDDQHIHISKCMLNDLWMTRSSHHHRFHRIVAPTRVPVVLFG